MDTVVCHRWCQSKGNISGPEPAIATLNAMLDECADFLAVTGTHAVAMETQSWHRPEGIALEGKSDFLAEIRLEVTAGLATRSFRSWHQWWHPRWIWSARPFPEKFLLASFDPLPGVGEADAQH